MNLKRTYRLLISALALGAVSYSPASAQTDAMIEGAKQCTRALPRFEREYGIPVHLLAAIASNESGRWHKGLNIALPWPWTINVEGKGYYFDSKAEAIAAVRKYQRQGKTSIDVGCMQVNLHHHGKAFGSLEEAFSPEHNVAYAASFLRSLYEEKKNWRAAAAAYHSRTPSYGSKYVAGVYDRWHTIINRVRSAKASLARATGNPQYAALSREEQHAATESSTPAPVKLTRNAPSTPIKVTKARPKSPTIKVISVREASSSVKKAKNDILVIRPQAAIAIEPGKVETATEEDKPMTLASATTSSPVINAKAPSHDTIPAGPRFIFND